MLNPEIAKVNIFLSINDKQLPFYDFDGLGDSSYDQENVLLPLFFLTAKADARSQRRGKPPAPTARF